MSTPMVVSIPHRLGRDEARRRLEEGLGTVHTQLAAYTTSIEQGWTGDRLDFRVVAMAQTVTGRVDVMDDHVRVEVDLPWMLAMLAKRLSGKIERTGAKLLTKG